MSEFESSKKFDPAEFKDYGTEPFASFDEFEVYVIERMEHHLRVPPGAEHKFGELLWDILVAAYDLCSAECEAVRAQVREALNSRISDN